MQDALVVELTKDESAKAAELYHRLSAAQADWNSFRLAIRDKYGPQLLPKNAPKPMPVVPPQGQTWIEMPEQWRSGIEFSKDFRFAVPAKPR
jgi:hypothetical protein